LIIQRVSKSERCDTRIGDIIGMLSFTLFIRTYSSPPRAATANRDRGVKALLDDASRVAAAKIKAQNFMMMIYYDDLKINVRRKATFCLRYKYNYALVTNAKSAKWIGSTILL
jgi:hypothetical protein